VSGDGDDEGEGDGDGGMDAAELGIGIDARIVASFTTVVACI